MDLLSKILVAILASLISLAISALPEIIRRFLGAFVMAILIAPSCWCIITGSVQMNFEEVVTQGEIGVPILFVFVFLFVFFGADYLKKRREKHLIQHQFAVAKELIQGRQYQKAQAILSTISDPKARQWEASLNRLIPHDPDFLRQLE